MDKSEVEKMERKLMEVDHKLATHHAKVYQRPLWFMRVDLLFEEDGEKKMHGHWLARVRFVTAKFLGVAHKIAKFVCDF